MGRNKNVVKKHDSCARLHVMEKFTKNNRSALVLILALAPLFLSVTSASANPSVGPIYGTPVPLDLSTINLTETLNADSTGWVVSFDQYDPTGRSAQYVVATDTGDSCSVFSGALGAQESCTLSLVNSDVSITPSIASVTYNPIVAMAGGTNPLGAISSGETTTTSPTVEQPAPVSLDTTNSNVTDNGDGTFTMSILELTGQTDSGIYTFTTTAGDSCTTDPTFANGGMTVECTITPSDGQQPIVDTVTWYPIVPTDVMMFSEKSAMRHHTLASGHATGTTDLWSAGVIGLLTTLGVLWLNARARRRQTL